MALRRYRHTAPAPLEVNAVNTTALTTVGLTTTGTSGPVNFPEQVGIVKEFANDVEDFIVRPKALSIWNGGISWTRSAGTSQRGLRIMAWDNNGVRNNWFSVWNGSVGIGSGLNSAGNFVGPRSKLHVGEDLHLGGTDSGFVTIKQPGGANTDGLYIERSGEQKGYYMYVNPAKADSLVFTRNNDGTKADAFEISRTGNVTVTTGNLIIGTAGQGIDFSATANSISGTMNSELFDDYETGVWTPTVSTPASRTITSAFGTYTKIGRMVHCLFEISGLNTATSGVDVQFAGLPFSSSSLTYAGYALIGDISGVTYAANYSQLYARVATGSSSMQLLQRRTDGTTHDTFTVGGGLATTVSLRGMVSYFA